MFALLSYVTSIVLLFWWGSKAIIRDALILVNEVIDYGSSIIDHKAEEKRNEPGPQGKSRISVGSQ